MDLNQLKSFIAIAEENGFTRAAARMFITQPAISRHIKLLEEELGERLFERLSRKVVLTTAGKILYRQAKRIFAAAETARSRIGELGDLKRGNITFACSDTFSTHILLPVLSHFMREHPLLKITIFNKTSSQISRMMIDAEIDFGIAMLPCAQSQLLEQSILEYEDCAVVCPTHPLALGVSVNLSDLADCRLLVLEKGTTTRDLLDAAFVRDRLETRSLMEVGSVEVQKAFAKIGLGAAIVPDYSVKEESRTDSLRVLNIAGMPKRSIGLVTRKDHYLPKAVLAFIEFLKSRI